jgi:hypothetical protein
MGINAGDYTGDYANEHDAALRVSFHSKFLRAYSAWFTVGVRDRSVIELFEETLKSSNNLYAPTSDDLFQRREVYRYLGMFTYILKDGPGYLQKAADYYRQGEPVIEARDIRTVVFYLYTMNDLGFESGNSSYRKKAYDVSEQVYNTRFEQIDDNDWKFAFLQNMVVEKAFGEIVPKDRLGADKLNDTIRSLGSDFIQDYERNKQMIWGN